MRKDDLLSFVILGVRMFGPIFLALSIAIGGSALLGFLWPGRWLWLTPVGVAYIGVGIVAGALAILWSIQFGQALLKESGFAATA
jgi:hypothetical protein